MRIPISTVMPFNMLAVQKGARLKFSVDDSPPRRGLARFSQQRTRPIIAVMPRRPRLFLDGIPLHVVQRGHNREPCFFTEDDYSAYLYWLKPKPISWCVSVT